MTAFYLGEETYDDSKFYWKNIMLQDVLSALRKKKSTATGYDNISDRMIISALSVIMFLRIFSIFVYKTVCVLNFESLLLSVPCPRLEVSLS